MLVSRVAKINDQKTGAINGRGRRTSFSW